MLCATFMHLPLVPECIEKLGACPKLRSLSLKNNAVFCATNLECCPQLWNVDLANNQVCTYNCYNVVSYSRHFQVYYLTKCKHGFIKYLVLICALVEHMPRNPWWAAVVVDLSLYGYMTDLQSL